MIYPTAEIFSAVERRTFVPSYEKNKSSGLWSVRFRENTPGEGTRNKRLSGFKTKREAQYGYEDYINERQKRLEEAELNKAVEQSPNDILFGDLVKLYYQYKKSRIKDTSYYDITKKIDSKILPFYAEFKVRDITPAKVLEWQTTLEKYSYQYRKNLYSLLASIFNYGEKYHDITNVMIKVDRPRNLEPKKEMSFWTPEEFSQFIKKVEKEPYKHLFKFLFLSGCRRGEALALYWDDIDLDNGIVKVSKYIAYKVGEGGKPYHITTPKNFGSNRSITLPKFYCDELREYQQWQKENSQCTSFVFGGTDPLPPTSIDREFIRAIKEAKVKTIRIHDLRHSCASLLIHKGISIVAVSRRLGHTSIEQTLNTYSHMMPDDQSMILDTLNTLSTVL